ncbi:hypothetical protein [Anaerococcus tetradius]|uniref:Uncharacterized protein n=1 Tax=Anaerococcus tetradius ATCC 35098 TaxID=525255 RepID=C2CFW0_9FIRM|nr:hypothetical protein [Anaerococcus tetradius]EEI83488.1 hypothetical protein HMPREF0077_0370 [Anaerococcus tetradius ATCC 35098]
MIIRDNLYEGDQILSYPKARGMYNFITILSKSEIDNLEENKKYTISLNLNQTENGSGYVNFGRVIGSSLQDFKKNSVKDRLELTFDKTENTRILCYTDLAGKTDDVGLKAFNIKLEFGDAATQYIPHKSKVKAENQAIFPIGGGYHEVYPL